LNIPLSIPDELDKLVNDTILVELSFFGPKQYPFGQKVVLKVKVNEGEQELNLYKAAINLTEAGLGTFDECVEALQKCSCDENAACEMLVEKNRN